MAYIRSVDKIIQPETEHLFDAKKLTRQEKADAFRFLAAQNLSKRGLHPMFEVKLDLAPFDVESMSYLNYLSGRRADVLAIGGGYSARLKPAYSYINKPYA